MDTNNRDIAILIPLYNDWESLLALLASIKETVPPELSGRFIFIVVNDASTAPRPGNGFPDCFPVRVLNLIRNMGHQKAIATGLAYLAAAGTQYKHVIVMDADGEDRPQDIPTLMEFSAGHPGKIIYAQRTRRQEQVFFRLSYWVYKQFYHLATGKNISFGNYCVIPGNILQRLVHVHEIWSHFSAGVIRSNIPYLTVPTIRGKRLHGTSTMNYPRLILHGLGAISVEADIFAVRLIILSSFIMGTALFGIACAFAIRLFTDWAMPGWATAVVIGLSMLALQSFLLIMFMLFIVMSHNSNVSMMPWKNAGEYIASVEDLWKTGAI